MDTTTMRHLVWVMLVLGCYGVGDVLCAAQADPSSTTDERRRVEGQAGSVEPRRDPARVTGSIPVRKLSTGKVGIVGIPPSWQDTEENWLKVFTKAQEAGAQLLSLGYTQWNEEIEPSPGVYDWSAQERMFSVLRRHDFAFEVALDMGGPFFHEELKIPRDLHFSSFADPVLIERYQQLLTSFLDRFGPQITYLVIHAEGAYAYFGTHPEQLEDYCQFIEAVARHVKRHSPHLQVGINTETQNNPDAVLLAMNRVTDFMAYMILQEERITRPADLEQVIARLIRLSGGKKIAIHDGGWYTSTRLGSSDQQQVEFIREFYRLLYEHRDEIEYASYYTLYDEDTAITRAYVQAWFPNTPDQWRNDLIDSLATLGLHRHDGTPKPGWDELKEQISAYYQRLEH